MLSPDNHAPDGAGASLRPEIVQSLEQLMRHRDAWIDLLGSSLCDQVTLSPLWLAAWWKLFGPLGGRRLCACLFWEGSELVGLAPLQRRWSKAGCVMRPMTNCGA